jgi:two-component system, OmpR family, sensor kinase
VARSVCVFRDNAIALAKSQRRLVEQAAYHPSEFNPAGLLHEVRQLHRDTTRGADIREEFGELPAISTGDSKLLFAMFSNLLSNAIKYSATGSPVHVIARAERRGGWVISVRDCGIGIVERDRAHLFERYFRGMNVASVAGSGVGLHLVALVLSLHGGSIEVESREGAGSTFTVRLPRSATSNAQTSLSNGAA